MPDTTADKPTILIRDDLPTGVKANIGAVLGMSLGHLRPGFIGPDIKDAEGTRFPGITTMPIPVLGVSAERMGQVFEAAGDLPIRVPFTRTALEAKDYTAYQSRVGSESRHEILGLLLCGPRKAVSRLCGHLPLLR
ncbi:MAG: hypothetical protein CR964_01645 [Rhodobacterales bacterium]|nr:MAG: hypothetical protein CR964_01645 [Rhodobacterales bacterium]